MKVVIARNRTRAEKPLTKLVTVRPRMDLFAAVGDRPRLDQINHASENISV